MGLPRPTPAIQADWIGTTSPGLGSHQVARSGLHPLPPASPPAGLPFLHPPPHLVPPPFLPPSNPPTPPLAELSQPGGHLLRSPRLSMDWRCCLRLPSAPFPRRSPHPERHKGRAALSKGLLGCCSSPPTHRSPLGPHTATGTQAGRKEEGGGREDSREEGRAGRCRGDPSLPTLSSTSGANWAGGEWPG